MATMQTTYEEVIGWRPASELPASDGKYLSVRVISITTDKHGLTTIRLWKFWNEYTTAAGWKFPLTGWREEAKG